MNKIIAELIKHKLIVNQHNNSKLEYINPEIFLKELNYLVKLIRYVKLVKGFTFLLTEDLIKIEIVNTFFERFKIKNNIICGTNKKLHSYRRKKRIKLILILDDFGTYTENIFKREFYQNKRLVIYPISTARPSNGYTFSLDYDTKNKLFWLLTFIKRVNKYKIKRYKPKKQVFVKKQINNSKKKHSYEKTFKKKSQKYKR